MTRRILSENLDDEFRQLKASDSDPQREALAARKLEQKKAMQRFRMASVYNDSSYQSADIIGIAPEYHIPQLENSSLELPRYRQEIVSWCDYYYQTNELIGTAVDIHATLSVADFAISCSDRAIQQEYEDMLEQLDYTELLYEIAQEYFRVGNVFPIGNYDEDDMTWTEFTLIPMLNVDLKKPLSARNSKIYLMPNDHIKQMMNDPDLQDELNEFPDEVRTNLKQGIPVLLDSNRVSHISTKAIAGTLWGVPPIYRCFKTLVYSDKLFRAQEAIADGHVTPLRIISLATQDGYPVTPAEEANFREQLIEAQYDPNFIILTSGIAKDAYIGSNGRILPLMGEMDNIERKITSGLKINKALLHGEGPTYANAQVYQTTMNTYYLHFRNRLRQWLLRKVFTPIAKARGYYDKSDTELATTLDVEEKIKRLILPEIHWSGLGNIDQQTTMMIKDLWMGKKISTKTYMSIVIPNIDPEEEAIQVLREAEEAIALQQVAPNVQKQLDKPHNIEDEAEDCDKESEKTEPSTKPKDSPLKIVKNRREYLENMSEDRRKAVMDWLSKPRKADENK